MYFGRAGQVVAQSLPWRRARRQSRLRTEPERVVLPARPSRTPSERPAVRIFVGTEPAQYRAERAFIWSIEQVRDPARVYEIFLMKELTGFDRRLWLTGFTNYRFAVPDLAGGRGRAIYNDVDQVYLTDPAELFDLDMGGQAVMIVPPLSRPDTSVMLMDCRRMIGIWTRQAAQARRKSALLQAAFREPGLAGELAPEWNARDDEYAPARSKLLHLSTIHWQPWQPFPKRYVYQRNPVGHVWRAYEHSADAAGYEVFDFARPSTGYRQVCRTWQPGELENHGARQDIEALRDKTGAKSILDYVPGAGTPSYLSALHSRELPIARLDPAFAPAPQRNADFDGVICTQGLDYLEDDDIAWVLEALFSRARQFVYLHVGANRGAGQSMWPVRREPAWWFSRIQAVGVRHPEVHWRIAVEWPSALGRARRYQRDGGRRLQGLPTLWVLADEKPGHTTQSIGLARALDFPFEVKELRFNPLVRAGNFFLGPLTRFGVPPLAFKKTSNDSLASPWPDIVLATGWRAAAVVRWMGARSHGRTRTIELGRKGANVAERFDAAISCGYLHLPAHPRRIETVAPLNQVSATRLQAAAYQFAGCFGDARPPRVAVLVGGSTRRFQFGPEAARRMGKDVHAWAEAAGAAIFAITSRRTGAAATEALQAGLGADAHIHRWRPNERENPYLGYLALADAIVVTGESESMMAEAAACGKPVYIYPVPERPPTPWIKFKRWIEGQAHSRRTNKRGKVRPQQGLEYLCAWLIARGVVPPCRHLEFMQRELIDRDIARPFGAPLETGEREPLREAAVVAEKVRELLALPAVTEEPLPHPADSALSQARRIPEVQNSYRRVD
jgi:mitochondrial fission protein ELM1